MKSFRTVFFWMLSLVFLMMACEREDLPLTQGKGIWRESAAFRRLFVNGIQTDSTAQTGGFGRYHFRNNGRGNYETDLSEVDFDWYWNDGIHELQICFKDNGILQCRTQTVEYIGTDLQIWTSENQIDNITMEIVQTELTRIE